MKRLLVLALLVAGGCIGPLATDRAVLVRNVAGRPYLAARYHDLCQPEIVTGIDAECRAFQGALNKLVDDDVLGKTTHNLGPMLPEQKAELKLDLATARRALRAIRATIAARRKGGP